MAMQQQLQMLLPVQQILLDLLVPRLPAAAVGVKRAAVDAQRARTRFPVAAAGLGQAANHQQQQQHSRHRQAATLPLLESSRHQGGCGDGEQQGSR
jgi:hypothetical protein